MRVSASLVVATAFVATISGQSPQAPVFKGGVSLVAIDVTVLDKDDKPVPGLTADDFEVKLDGHVQSVRTASYEHVDVATSSSPTPTAVVSSRAEATNAVAAPEPRTVVVMLDDLSMPATRGRDLLLAATRFVARLPPTDKVGFTTTSGVGAVNPTRERAPIQWALRHATGQHIDLPAIGTTSSGSRDLLPSLPLGIEEAIDIDAGNQGLLKVVVARDCFGGNTALALTSSVSSCAEDVERKVREWAALIHRQIEQQVGSYSAVIRAMQSGQGRKILVLLSDGLITAERGKDGAVALEEISRAAAAGGVELSVLCAGADDVSMNTRTAQEAAVRRTDGVAQMTGIQTVADITGGTFWRVMGQPERFFDFVGQATSGVYHLGVEMPAGGTKPNFALAVRVKQTDLTVHANHVAVPPAAIAEPSTEDQVKQAIASGAPHYGVPISVSALVRRGASASELIISTNVDVPGNPRGPLTVTFGLVDEAGQIKSGRTTVVKPTVGDEYRVSTSLPVKPGNYSLRFAVQDATGHVGSIETRIAAQLMRAGPLTTSDLVTAWSAADGKPQFLALGDVPAAATSVGALLEIYADTATPPANVQIKWELVNDAQQSVASVTTSPISSRDRLVAHAEFPAASIPPGAYDLKATILVAGEAVGVTSAPIQKAAHSDCGADEATCLVTPTSRQQAARRR